MTELVTRAQADLLMNVVFVLGLVTGAVAAWLAKRRGERRAVQEALLWGGPLLLAGLLWRIYNVITDRLGLDSVANLAVNAALFVFIGAMCGCLWGFLARRQGTAEDPLVQSEEAPSAPQ